MLEIEYLKPLNDGYILKTFDGWQQEAYWLLDEDYNFRSLIANDAGNDEYQPYSGILFDICWFTKPYQNFFDKNTPNWLEEDWHKQFDWKGEQRKPFQFVLKLKECNWDTMLMWDDENVRKYFGKMLETLE